jgi:putative phosphoesterase
MPNARHKDPHMLVGLISDTHGLMRPEALRALEGAQLILHAGDVGRSSVLDALRGIAPVYAVYGNVDATNGELQSAVDVVLAGVRVHLSHGHELGSPTPAALAARYDADVIVYGHTHRALITQIGQTLVVNPGAAGAARFDLKPSIGLLTLPSREARIVLL